MDPEQYPVSVDEVNSGAYDLLDVMHEARQGQ